MRRLVLLAAVVCIWAGFPALARPLQDAAPQPSPTGAKPSMRDATREKRIEGQLSAAAPSALSDFQAATRALRRLGTALVIQGRIADGFALLSRALRRERSPENLFATTSLLAFPAPGKEGGDEDLRHALAAARFERPVEHSREWATC